MVLVSAVVLEGTATVLVAEELGEVELIWIWSLSFVVDVPTETLVDSSIVLVVEECRGTVLVVSPVLDSLPLTLAATKRQTLYT